MMRWTGIALIAAGTAVLVAKMAGLLGFLGGGASIALILGLPSMGGFLWFVDRSLGRPAGIDNDHIMHDGLTRRGWIAIVLGLLLTGFYVVIYMGDDVRIAPVRIATLQLASDGTILDRSGDSGDLGQYAITDAALGRSYAEVLPEWGGIHKSIQSVLDGEKEESRAGLNASYAYSAKTKAVGEGDAASAAAIVEFSVTDTLHHLAGRTVYRLFDPLSQLLRGQKASNWFVYGTLYTLGVLVFGVRMLLKYRHNNYHVIRTISVMFFQLGFAYMIPNLLVFFKQPEFYFSYFWPLKPEYLYPSTVLGYASQAGPGLYFVGIAAFMTFVATPLLTYKFGKRWYCSWVCGCGGLAETLGDPFRQLSDKTLAAWRSERWIVHGVLAAIALLTGLIWIDVATGYALLGKFYNQSLTQAYGLYIGALFSGIIGVGFYPLMGNRVWCRFGCPMAAILGLFQRFWSRFRITTNGGQCISCGNCSTYCEMGIDVRWYAQRGQNIVRASCVGCGVCAAVCPRGVLRLENKDDSIFTRFNEPDATVLR